ncbi:MAG: hypothetical protein COW01_01335 [Bdellovibrionales bacterium CG12_big_fil_rev_8_21_14_0_65_38_15]|nr:MAG: hypothetical protein COW79_03285 [Bdellovibrionales bacterium CG22_combo_CG10-13_8_21_14_all_38_13]PIQ57275.1 MAG: hypothetical protein COW01_01335 [Bdellovibrionales bacterium CG12_big_fil_rev_8_21_14_0_65_38_15]PIR29681.1 MAG: hypothetical protein COV38_09630 [Bdellovibrionales bacterium CG11_big_fil_rev_8_21_14_0_20_38_13]
MMMRDNPFLKVIYAFVGLGLLGAVITVIVIISFSFSLPKITSLNDYRPPIPSKILAKDGTILANIGIEDRVVAEIDEIPSRIIGAFLSAEDDKFYEHKGVDYLGVIRAMIANIKAGRVVQGGSTITQQVAKSLLLTSERSISRKIKDFLLALRIEKHLAKDEILYLYLNQVYLGGGYYGVKAAFKGYFNKDLGEATVAESAMVAGLLVAPGRYSPYMSTQAATRRQHYVLGRMFETGKITEEEYKAALDEKIKFRIRKLSGFKAGFFTDWVRQRVVEAVGEENFLSNGFVVETTLDWSLQEIAEKEIVEGAREIDKRQGFKGPLKNLPEDQWNEFFQKKRIDIYADTSEYFTIDDELNRVYEYKIDETIWDRINEYEKEFKTNSPTKRIHAGFVEDDALVDLLKRNSIHEAIVTDTDDLARLVYVKVAGVAGIIPYEMFRWAHERVISPDRVFYPYVTKPSTILKRGDVVQVRIFSNKTNLRSRVTDDFKKYLDKLKDDKKVINNQKYILCSLEQEPDAQAALVSLNPYSGEIISLVGGTNFNKSQFNRALQALRQPGSSFKPILYAAAIENGFTPSTLVIDSPEALGGVEGLNWKPRNYDGEFKGPMTLRRALEVSRNVPTIKIAQDLGVDKVHDFSKRIGLDVEMPKDLSLSLGSFGVNLLNLTATYGIFPNGGKKLKPKAILSITDRDGKRYFLEDMDGALDGQAEPDVAEEPTQTAATPNGVEEGLEEVAHEKVINPFLAGLSENQVYDPRLSYVMTNLLRGVVLYGTGQGAKEVSTFLGGKTGTTNNYVDAWFMGFSSNLVTGVWTGFDNNETLGFGETGAKSALPIWKEFMRAGLKRYGENDFRVPSGIVNVVIDRENGRLIRSGSPGAFTESFAEGTEPGSVEEQKNDVVVPDTSGPIFEEDEYFNNQ